jgi:flavin reductase (DIM6/NTAB) family NADH-FMN oxidoreductase RutF
MSVDVATFKLALGSFASAVTVVTLEKPDGTRGGLTVTAFSSLSLDPPLVLFCLGQKSRWQDAFAKEALFAINFLAVDQQDVSHKFASSKVDPYEGLACSPSPHGAPWIDGCVACLECRVAETFTGGDHTIIVGRVENAAVHARQPLLYFRGAYAQLV